MHGFPAHHNKTMLIHIATILSADKTYTDRSFPYNPVQIHILPVHRYIFRFPLTSSTYQHSYTERKT